MKKTFLAGLGIGCVSLISIAMALTPVDAVGAGNNVAMEARIKDIDRELQQVDQEKSRVVATLRQEGQLIEEGKARLEKEDAEFRRLRAALQDLEKQAAQLRAELDERLKAVDRYAVHVDEYRRQMTRLEELRLKERRLELERHALEARGGK